MERSKASVLLAGFSVVLIVGLSSARRADGEHGVAGRRSIGGLAGISEAAVGRAVVGWTSGGRAAEGWTVVGWTTDGRAEPMTWLTIEEVAAKLQQLKKPVLIDLYTTWCGWCKQMDRKTYSNSKVAQYLQEKFYTVKVDAETRATITWLGKTYHFNPQYRSNEFALYLTHGRLEFPTTIIIVPGEEPQAIPGYMEPKDLELLVRYFGEGAYKNRSFDEYQKSFRASW